MLPINIFFGSNRLFRDDVWHHEQVGHWHLRIFIRISGVNITGAGVVVEISPTEEVSPPVMQWWESITLKRALSSCRGENVLKTKADSHGNRQTEKYERKVAKK